MLVHVLDWSMDEIWIARDPQNLGDPAEEKRMYRKLKVVPFHVTKGNYKAVADGVCGAGLYVQKTYTPY
jgi:hypothetical protein